MKIKKPLLKALLCLSMLTFTLSTIGKAQFFAYDDSTWLAANDTDVITYQFINDSTPSGYHCSSILSGPSNGTAFIDTYNLNAIRYTPTAGYSGSDSILYKIYLCANPTISDSAWIKYTIVNCSGSVTLPNHSIMLATDSLFINPSFTSIYPITRTTWNHSPVSVTSFWYKPSFHHLLQFVITDSAGCSFGDWMLISVVNDTTITCLPDSSGVFFNSDSTLISVVRNDRSGGYRANVVTSQHHNVTITKPPANGTAVVAPYNVTPYPSGNGVYYTPNTGFIGRDTIFYMSCSQWGACDSSYEVINVAPYVSCIDTFQLNGKIYSHYVYGDKLIVYVYPGDTAFIKLEDHFPSNHPLDTIVWYTGSLIDTFSCSLNCDSVWFIPKKEGSFGIFNHYHSYPNPYGLNDCGEFNLQIFVKFLPTNCLYDSLDIVGANKLDADSFELSLPIGDSVQLSAFFYNPNSTFTYNWTRFGLANADFSCANCDSTWFKPSGPGMYLLSVSDTAGCSDTIWLNVNANCSSQLTINGKQYTDHSYDSILVPQGDSSLITLNGMFNPSSQIDSVNWVFPAGMVNCDTCLSVYMKSNTTPQNGYVTVYDVYGCTLTVWWNVSTINSCSGNTNILNQDTAFVNPATPVVIDVRGNDFISGAHSLNIQLHPGVGSVMINADTTIIYTPLFPNVTNDAFAYEIVDSMGCSDTAWVIIWNDSINDCLECVWPGDANNDGIANNFDLLSIGLGYNEIGTYRFDQTISWDEKACFNWTNSSPLGMINYKYADTDGNGVVNVSDTTAISLNYGNVQLKGAGMRGGPNDPTLAFMPTMDTSGVSTVINIPIDFGTMAIPANNVYGVAFTINYNNTIVDTNSAELLFMPSWVGNSTNTISMQKDFWNNGSIDGAVTRTDHMNANGFGQIGVFRIATIENLAGKTAWDVLKELHLSFSNVRVIDNQENNIVINAKSDTLFITKIENEINLLNNVSIYPNPVQNQLEILTNNVQIEELRLLSMEGKLLERFEKIGDRLSIDLSSYSNGVYFIQMSNDVGVETKKIVISR